MRYFVLGFMDTRREFDVRGVTTSVTKANAWIKAQNKEREGQQHRNWPSAVETGGI